MRLASTGELAKVPGRFDVCGFGAKRVGNRLRQADTDAAGLKFLSGAAVVEPASCTSVRDVGASFWHDRRLKTEGQEGRTCR